VITKEYRRFAEFCDACRRYRYIGLCHGPPGVGKTLSARHYARWEILEPYLSHSLDRMPPVNVTQCHTVLYTPEVAHTPRSLATDLRALRRSFEWMIADATNPEGMRRFGDDQPERIELLIIDEADRLKMQGLEQARDLYDRNSFGLILIGMPGIEKRLSRYAQLYSRVGFVHAYRPLSADEAKFVLAHHWQRLGLSFSLTDFTDTEAVAAITRITGGNFRLINRLFAQIERILEINQMQTITKEVVTTAREGLVIGAA